MTVLTVPTRPFPDQQPGTAGLRKPVKVFAQAHYLENFLQAIFDTCPELKAGTLVIGGDGRYHNREAIATLLRMAAANGVSKAVVGRQGLLSTPAASLLIPHLHAAGGFILSASHNPGGPDGDFGIKFNVANGGQASETLTNRIHFRSRELDRYFILQGTTAIDLDRIQNHRLGDMQVEIVDPVSHYADTLERLFDFGLIHALLQNAGFRMRFDAMHAVTGPYAQELFEKRLAAAPGSVLRAQPLPDFGGGHPDPNPHDAAELVNLFMAGNAPDFGAASDGDGDRNMILGRGVVVSPGDSLAVLAANAHLIPRYRDGLTGVARSMPTSRAVDRVAAKLGIPCHETPTGWRFFCNLLDAGKITLCGEESFGTSSNHAREKDGLWAVLFWLNLLAVRKQSVQEILTQHWREYGRDFFQREDYFIADADAARILIKDLDTRLTDLPGTRINGLHIQTADDFNYRDPVDGSESRAQGLRIVTGDGARIVYRLSGTGTRGATLRVYLEQHEADTAKQSLPASEALAELSRAARSIAQLGKLGLKRPDSVT
ncbi:MAG TPA: alpha-D-glucose phosphate-specific phosphoglucomutase [Gammaproteobacteria bacterium]|nr:alpha-D-glucose phosphate-specific phosphoglucomutase [Gammaproteobacteria bacterium]